MLPAPRGVALSLTLAVLCAVSGASASSPQPELPLEPARVLSMTAEEATWLSLDVSPDGSSVIFDLLGDIYRIPIAGGQAERLTGGDLSVNVQPRYSPDGRRITFISDRDGSQNLWIADADGTDARQLTYEDGAVTYISPEWSPDGDSLWVSRTGIRCCGSIELWRIPVGGKPERVPIRSTAGDEELSPLGVAFGTRADAYVTVRSRYARAVPGSTQILEFDPRSGAASGIIERSGSGAFRPTPSPDGRWLVFGTRERHRTRLLLRHLESGEQRWLMEDGLAAKPEYALRDGQRSFHPSVDFLPGFAFTPDSRFVVISAGGKIWRIDVASGSAAPIPFTVEVAKAMGPPLRHAWPVADEPVRPRDYAGVALSPDARFAAVAALGRVYVHDFDASRTQAVSPASAYARDPAWSPDGSRVVYATWSPRAGGHLFSVSRDGQNRRRLTDRAAYYAAPAVTPDGRRIVFVTSSTSDRIDDALADPYTPARHNRLAWLPSAGGPVQAITRLDGGGRPHLSGDGSRIWYFNEHLTWFWPLKDGLIELVGYDWTGRARERIPLVGRRARDVIDQIDREPVRVSQALMAPDVKSIFVRVHGAGYLLDISGGVTGPIALDDQAWSERVTALGPIGVDRAAWNARGDLLFSFGSRLTRLSAGGITEAVPAIGLLRHSSRPYALRNARILTMAGGRTIERGDIVIENRRLVAVGASGEVPLPAGAATFDLAGATIVPGLIDGHWHAFDLATADAQQPWQALVKLAYGNTAAFTPRQAHTRSSETSLFAVADMIDAGLYLGPRLYSAGDAFTVATANRVRSLDDVRRELRRYSEAFDPYVKFYAAGGRRLQQWVSIAASEQRLNVYIEGNSDDKAAMAAALDGFTNFEHYLTHHPARRDIVELFMQSRMGITPTSLVMFGAPQAIEPYMFETSPQTAPRIRRFTPERRISAVMTRPISSFEAVSPPGELETEQQLAIAAELLRRGGHVQASGHGDFQGIDLHWEIWNIARVAGNEHALRSATILGAENLGRQADLGSIEPGKIADLAVLGCNPLEEIRCTADVRYVVKDGALYVADTLARLAPEAAPPPDLWWRDPQ